MDNRWPRTTKAMSASKTAPIRFTSNNGEWKSNRLPSSKMKVRESSSHVNSVETGMIHQLSRSGIDSYFRAKRAAKRRAKLARKMKQMPIAANMFELCCPNCGAKEMHPDGDKLTIRGYKVDNYSQCLVCSGYYDKNLKPQPEKHDPNKGWFK